MHGDRAVALIKTRQRRTALGSVTPDGARRGKPIRRVYTVRDRMGGVRQRTSRNRSRLKSVAAAPGAR
jgi:hypothetical protein